MHEIVFDENPVNAYFCIRKEEVMGKFKGPVTGPSL